MKKRRNNKSFHFYNGEIKTLVNEKKTSHLKFFNSKSPDDRATSSDDQQFSIEKPVN